MLALTIALTLIVCFVMAYVFLRRSSQSVTTLPARPPPPSPSPNDSLSSVETNSSPIETKEGIPVAVNYHFSRKCNYSCGFCFHTYTNDFNLTLTDAKKGLKLLHEAGMRKINFAGGEPFLFPKQLGEMVEFCKRDLRVESVSIVSNGSKLTDKWFSQYGQYVDILAVSCDSFDPEVNQKIGRTSKLDAAENNHIENVLKAAELCRTYDIKFKLNTVVNRFNIDEDMSDNIRALNPSRWKVFQVLMLKTENDGGSSKRDATEFLISDEEFKAFIDRHRDIEALVPEDNSTMTNSYLILDERMRFLNCENGGKEPSESLLDVGVHAALKQSGFDFTMFQKRGGIYDWTREQVELEGCSSLPKELRW